MPKRFLPLLFLDSHCKLNFETCIAKARGKLDCEVCIGKARASFTSNFTCHVHGSTTESLAREG